MDSSTQVLNCASKECYLFWNIFKWFEWTEHTIWGGNDWSIRLNYEDKLNKFGVNNMKYYYMKNKDSYIVDEDW